MFLIIFASKMSEVIKIQKNTVDNIQDANWRSTNITSERFQTNRLNDSDIIELLPERKNLKEVFVELCEAL